MEDCNLCEFAEVVMTEPHEHIIRGRRRTTHSDYVLVCTKGVRQEIIKRENSKYLCELRKITDQKHKKLYEKFVGTPVSDAPSDGQTFEGQQARSSRTGVEYSRQDGVVNEASHAGRFKTGVLEKDGFDNAK